ncbi:Hsp70 family protein [Candidatus Poribacteria bacterium]|nr:Hsp70 family protein [Candidatus Poribacteria bacterium]
MVFDWGGGTLDITVVQVIDKELIELSTAGMNRAGDDFDKQLVRYAKDSLIEKLSASPKDLDFLPGDEDRFRAECERRKISLSEVESEMIQVENACKYRGQYQSLKQPISRKDLNGLTDKDVKMALAKVDEALEQANLSARDVDLALLIGGSSKIPDVRNQLREKFGYRTEVVKNANTIIAEGAAIVDGLGIQPTFARSICLELSDGTLYDVFKAGDIASPSVCRKRVNFYCTDNREGEARLIIKEQTGQVGTTRSLLRSFVNSREFSTT